METQQIFDLKDGALPLAPLSTHTALASHASISSIKRRGPTQSVWLDWKEAKRMLNSKREKVNNNKKMKRINIIERLACLLLAVQPAACSRP